MEVGKCMTYSGIYSYGSDFIFAITFSDINISVSVFKEQIPDSSLTLVPYMVVGKIDKEIRKFLVCHAITNKSGDVRAYYGSIVLLQQLIKYINNYNLMKLMS